ncbi:MAG: Trk system potassium transporter TrkA [Paramuribaculum sp.]|nr:Trk system potassium transporter TrkA [Paramuribaculum sp.]
MKIIIAGAGEVGTHLARLLSKENHDIVVIDPYRSRLEALDSSCNLLTLIGAATSFSVLKDAGIAKCDLFISVTQEENSNLMACCIAKSLGAKRTVARIDNYEYMRPENRDFFTKAGVDSMIYPELLAAKEILKSLEHSWTRNWLEIHNGKLIVVGVKIRENSRLAGLQLKNISMSGHDFHISAIKRHHETIIPRGNDYILANDIIYVTTTLQHLDTLREDCGKSEQPIKKVMIMGGSRIAVRLTTLAESKYKFSILDIDRDRCGYLAERCPDASIIHGDARDTDTLIEENIAETDAFIALSDSSESNILTSLIAKDYGVSKTVAEVENIQFISEAETLNIGTIINKKLLASSKIFQMMLDSDTETSKFMALADADVAEIEAKKGSKVTRGMVKDLNLSHDMTIAGLIRNGEGMLVKGDTVIREGDSVVVFCLSGAIHKVERLFR